MMIPEMLSHLQAADDGNAFVEPEDFDDDLAWSRVEPLIPIVEAILGEKFDVPYAEGCFFADLICYRFRSPGDSYEADIILGLRFSNFGGLFTLYAYEDSKEVKSFTEEQIKQVVAVIEGAGFHYVDMQSLAETYTGRHAGMYNVEDLSVYVDILETGQLPGPSRGTWGGRFFSFGSDEQAVDTLK